MDEKKKKIVIIAACVLAAIATALTIVMLVVSHNKNKKNNTEEQSSTESVADTSKDDESDALETTSDGGGEDVSENETTAPENEDKTPAADSTGGKLNTGNLSADATEYEGVEGSGDYNYGEALQKSLLFYELQRSGKLPENVRCNWRGDSALSDGSDVGLDLTGGWYDAGDHVKFNLPMAYTASMLAWSVYEDKASYEESGQLQYALDNIKWANDYFIKCHPEKYVYYYQVGDGSADHAWWGPAETMTMDRPSYKVDKDNPGSCVVGEAAASLAACSVVFKDTDAEYSELCLKHAKELYEFADETRSDAGYTAANGFYNSWSGFYDELGWAAMWLYYATGDDSYIKASKDAISQASADYNWAHCWDNVYYGTCLLLARETGEDTYKNEIEKHLNVWTTGADGLSVDYTPKGLAYIDAWGALRYAETTAFLAALYSSLDICPSDKKDAYWDFAEDQVNYALGSSGHSFVVGFGEDSPKHPHHRTAQGSYTNNMNDPDHHRHVLYGALVGGPDANDNYDDSVSNYQMNEVACDYNAGFTGALARMYSKYKGQTLVNFGAVEKITEEELSVHAGVNVKGDDFVEIRAFVYNMTGWPARHADKLELRYFMDLSEVINAGKSAEDVEMTGNYMQGGTIGGLHVWDEKKNIYYASIDFTGTDICPGGQDAYKKEVQFRMACTGVKWDNDNDPSFAELKGNDGSSQVPAAHMALYEDGTLVYGTEPGKGENAGQTVGVKDPSEKETVSDTTGETTSFAEKDKPAASGNGDGIKVANKAGSAGDGGTININLELTNTSDSINLSEIEIDYFFTKDGDAKLNFYPDYSGMSSSDGYATIKDVVGAFSTQSGKDCDTVCKITCKSTEVLKKDGVWTIQARIAKEDWSAFDFGNDYSASSVNNIVIKYQGKVIFGNNP